MTTTKGLNLPPVDAAKITYGLADRLRMPGRTYHLGHVVIRANKTVPPHGQQLTELGYCVERSDNGDGGVKLVPFSPAAKTVRPIVLHPGLIIGSGEVVACERVAGGWEWIFKRVARVEKRCPRCWGTGFYDAQTCPVCDGNKKTKPVVTDGSIRRIWFQW